MKHGFLNVLGWVTATGLALVPVARAVDAVGPYYATPSWDQKLSCGTTVNCPRFVVLTNWGSQAVLDRETGLVWERAPATDNSNQFTQVVANTHCRALQLGGRFGWRLPRAEELQSLMDPSDVTGSLPPGHPFQNIFYESTSVEGLLLGSFWSVERPLGLPAYGIDVQFRNTGPTQQPYDVTPPDVRFAAWCVRSGTGTAISE